MLTLSSVDALKIRSRTHFQCSLLTVLLATVLGAALGTGTERLAFGFSSKKKPTSPVVSQVTREPDPQTEQWLTALNRQGQTNLDRETEERQTFLKERARKFAEYTRMNAAERHRTLARCNESGQLEKNDPFCTLMSDSRTLGVVLGQTGRHGGLTPHRQARTAKTWLLQGKVDELSNLGEHDVGAAVRSFSSFEPLEQSAQKVIASSDCRYAALSFQLGAKAEEYLPEESFRQKAIRLYEITARCGDVDAKARASYRYSLLQIWADNCAAAMPYLTELANQTQTRDYRSRALYWKAHCGFQIGTPQSRLAAQSAKDLLVAEFPFALHSLLIRRDDSQQLKSVLTAADSVARFRSQTKPSLNVAVAAAEALMAIDEVGVARRVLTSISVEADGAEPEFQIYLAWLFNQAGDYVNKFRTLTVVFRDHPASISRTALLLYYPRRDLQIEVLRQVGVGELVIMALIRQESAFNVRARSPAGAMGLMQIMPQTARVVERGRSSNLFDPISNVRIGSKYFSTLLKQYDGDTELALAAYNAGPRRVEQWVKRYNNIQQRVLFLDLIPFRETREYVASIARNYFWYTMLYSEAPVSSEKAKEQKLGFDTDLQSVFKTFGT